MSKEITKKEKKIDHLKKVNKKIKTSDAKISISKQ